MAGHIHWDRDDLDLRPPVLLVCLDGFIDAGSAGATAATFLRHRWRSEVVATFDRDTFVDFRARRPTAVLDSGVLRRIEWPDLQLLAATVEGPRDAMFLLGPEPDMRWEAFCRTVIDVCRRAQVGIVITLGAYPAAAPHTRPVRVMRADNGVPLELALQATPVPGYTGPVGAATVLQHRIGEAAIPALGLWAEVPHYIAATPHPGSALALVQAVAAALATEVDTTELEAAAQAHRAQVDEAVTEHPEAAGMIAALERRVDSGGDTQDVPSGDDLAAEIERFLQNQQDQD